MVTILLFVSTFFFVGPTSLSETIHYCTLPKKYKALPDNISHSLLFSLGTNHKKTSLQLISPKSDLLLRNTKAGVRSK
ncbi:hypothetical protein F4801DRAFT_572431 [Xylaria longipes]|nr:hypothetical protein F4801DRAFT_572431 [Xylaria longipes]